MINQYSLEIRLQSSLTHGNILPMYGFFDDKSHLYIVLEYMEGGTLYSKLKKEGKLTERDTANVIRQITLAIEYLHDMGIAHRDIKPENIVIADVKLSLFRTYVDCATSDGLFSALIAEKLIVVLSITSLLKSCRGYSTICLWIFGVWE